MEHLDEQDFAADGVEGLEQFGFEQAFGRDAGPADLSIHCIEERREFAQGLVNKRFDGAQRMVFGHELLR